MFPKVGMLTQMPCQQKWATAAVAGAVVCATGNDTYFLSYSPMLTPIVHYGLAGIAVDVLCRQSLLVPTSTENVKELSRNAMYGIAGACVYKMIY